MYTCQTVTGVLPPITPITPETYKTYNLPWFTLSDSNIATLAPGTDRLGKVKSIVDVDHEKVASQKGQAQNEAEAFIDPDRPPGCSMHRNVLAEVVFRPCGHTACSGCLGRAMLKRSRCPNCSGQIARFVGIKEPVAGVDEDASGDNEEVRDPEAGWNVMLSDLERSEALAAEAVNQGKVVVIHLEKDKVAPLHSNDGTLVKE